LGLLGILLGLGFMIWLAFRGWSALFVAPAAALIAAAFGREPLLANWTQKFMGNGAHFLARFFPLFLLGAAFGKLMDDSGSVSAVLIRGCVENDRAEHGGDVRILEKLVWLSRYLDMALRRFEPQHSDLLLTPLRAAGEVMNRARFYCDCS